jgi:nucleotide-binding universal stress UspA family protein
MAIESVVVGVDGSAHSQRALAWAVDYAKLSGAPLRVIAVWDVTGTLGGQVWLNDVDFQQRAEQQLDEAVAQTVPADVVHERAVVQGHPAEVLTRESHQAQLLVLGSRGRGGFAGLLLGSTTGYCSHHAGCPVVIVRGR